MSNTEIKAHTINAVADQAINQRIAEQHPHLKPIMARPTTPCHTYPGLCTPLVGLSIVSALVNEVQVPVACPTAWCAEKHATEGVSHVVDIDHVSEHADLSVPAFHGGEDLHFAYAHLGQDTYASDPQMREPHVRVEDGGGEASYLNPDQALKFADNLAAFADQIRGLVHTARGGDA